MKPISNDKRADIIAAKQRNESVKNIMQWFNVCERTIGRIWNKYLKTGTYEAIPYTGRKSDITKEKEEEIYKKVKETPDITLEDLIEELDINLTVSGLSRHMAKMGLTLKKRLSMLMEKDEKMLYKEEKNGKNNKKN